MPARNTGDTYCSDRWTPTTFAPSEKGTGIGERVCGEGHEHARTHETVMAMLGVHYAWFLRREYCTGGQYLQAVLYTSG